MEYEVKSKLLTLHQVAEQHPAFNVNILRHLIKSSPDVKPSIIRINGRIYIDIIKFDEYLESKRSG